MTILRNDQRKSDPITYTVVLVVEPSPFVRVLGVVYLNAESLAVGVALLVYFTRVGEDAELPDPCLPMLANIAQYLPLLMRPRSRCCWS